MRRVFEPSCTSSPQAALPFAGTGCQFRHAPAGKEPSWRLGTSLGVGPLLGWCWHRAATPICTACFWLRLDGAQLTRVCPDWAQLRQLVRPSYICAMVIDRRVELTEGRKVHSAASPGTRHPRARSRSSESLGGADPDARVFAGFSTGMRTRTDLGRACSKAGIPSFSPQDLRHRRAVIVVMRAVFSRRVPPLCLSHQRRLRALAIASTRRRCNRPMTSRASSRFRVRGSRSSSPRCRSRSLSSSIRSSGVSSCVTAYPCPRPLFVSRFAVRPWMLGTPQLPNNGKIGRRCASYPAARRVWGTHRRGRVLQTHGPSPYRGEPSTLLTAHTLSAPAHCLPGIPSRRRRQFRADRRRADAHQRSDGRRRRLKGRECRR